MKITFDTAGKGFLARLGDLILDKFDGSKAEAIGALTQAVATVAGRLGDLGEDDGDIEGFYAACISHRDAGFEWSQSEADKLAEYFGVTAPPVKTSPKSDEFDTGIHKSWFALFEFLDARGVSGSGDHAADAIDYIKALESARDKKAAS